MKINSSDPCLVIDSSSNLISISVHYKNNFDIINQNFENNITKNLLPNIDILLKKNNFKIKNIKCIIYSKGPGSFTSLRIGLSIAKGLALPFDIPLIGISKLDVIAFKAKSLKIKNKLILSYIEATKNEIYYAIYETQSLFLKKKYNISKIDEIFKNIVLNNIFIIGSFDLKYNLNNFVFNPKANDYFNIANNYEAVDCDRANLLYVRNKIALTIDEQNLLYNENKNRKY